MQSTLAYLALHVLSPVFVVVLTLLLLRLAHRLAPENWSGVLWLSLAQLVLYFATFFAWYGLAESDNAPWSLWAAVCIFSMPLTYLCAKASRLWLDRWLGNDGTIYMFIPFPNAVVWGLLWHGHIAGSVSTRCLTNAWGGRDVRLWAPRVQSNIVCSRR